MTMIVTLVLVVLIIAVYYFLLHYQSTRLIEKFTTWLIFSVTIALTPLLFGALLVYITGGNPTSVSLLSRGELLIVAVAIGAESSGRIIASSRTRKAFKILTAGSNLVLVILSSLLFASIVSSLGIRFDKERVSQISHYLFLFTMVTSASCVLLAESEVEV